MPRKIGDIPANQFVTVGDDLAPCAFSGSYTDLTNKPSIPAAQVNTDWNALSGVAQVLNKPTLGTAAAQNVSAFATAAQGTKADSALQNAALFSPAIAYYNAAGLISAVVKKWVGIVSPNTANGYSIDISSAGFTTILNVQIICIRNTSAATSSPNVSIKSISTTAIVCNIVEASTAQVTILGSSVVAGLPIVFASTAGLQLQVMVEGT
jgi:hypothetical protein